MTNRRFPSPLDRRRTSCFVVHDHNGQQLPAKLLTRDEARRIAANIARNWQA